MSRQFQHRAVVGLAHDDRDSAIPALGRPPATFTSDYSSLELRSRTISGWTIACS